MLRAAGAHSARVITGYAARTMIQKLTCRSNQSIIKPRCWPVGETARKPTREKKRGPKEKKNEKKVNDSVASWSARTTSEADDDHDFISFYFFVSGIFRKRDSGHRNTFFFILLYSTATLKICRTYVPGRSILICARICPCILLLDVVSCDDGLEDERKNG